MTFAYVGNFEGSEWTTENDIRKAIEFLGHKVTKLQENKVSWQDIRFHALNSDLLLWTSTWDDAQPIKETAETVKLLGMRNIPSAAVHLDAFHGTDRGVRQWWMNPQWLMAYVFTASGDYEKEWRTMGVNHIWLPPAVRHDATHDGTFRKEYECDVAFVGSNGRGYHEGVWSYRKELLAALREMCKRNNWTFKNPGGDDAKIARGEDMNDFYRSAKITVGDSLCIKMKKSRYWSDRVPEALGRGGRLIMPRIDALAEIYSNKLPMYEWGDWKDLEAKIKHQLDSRDYKGTIDNKKFCFNETKNNHTYVNRVQTVLKELDL